MIRPVSKFNETFKLVKAIKRLVIPRSKGTIIMYATNLLGIYFIVHLSIRVYRSQKLLCQVGVVETLDSNRISDLMYSLSMYSSESHAIGSQNETSSRLSERVANLLKIFAILHS